MAVPDAFHADVACQGLEAGLHVLCEKPLALSLEECDRIAAARDASGRVLQVGTMKRYDPAYLRLLELLPESPADLRYLSIEVRDPDQGPFVAHLPMTAATDLAPELGARSCAPAWLRASTRPPAATRRPEARARSRPTSRRSCTTSACCRACSSTSARRGASRPTTAPGGTTDAPCRSRRTLPGGGRAHLVHHNLPGVNDYSERVTLHCSDRVLELTFPSPYLRHEPTRLVEIPLGRRHRPAQHACITSPTRRRSARSCAPSPTPARARGPVVTPVEAGRADVALLIDAYRHAVARA